MIGMAWQPIATAPKDGTVVDLWCGNLRRTDKWFGKHSRYDDAPCWGPYDGMEEDPLQPSHWMPIAGPPEKEQVQPLRRFVNRDDWVMIP